MSFYDLAKDGVLRPEDLFKCRLKRDCTIPSRGGQKEFEPDGSWLQNKRLETFLQERTSVLSEPRTEKLKNVVMGLWDEEKKLVNLKKPGKFWMHMGFTDERRNWLYPEEALYLMETNTLELYFKDRPMSIQEAFVKLLGHDVCLEEYQVFSHLRRLGYVVLRHEEERIFTDYERKINLNEYIDKKRRKELMKKGKGKSNKKISQNVTEISPSGQTSAEFTNDLNLNGTSNSTDEHAVKMTTPQLNHKEHNSNNSSQTSEPNQDSDMEISSVDSKKLKLDMENGESDPVELCVDATTNNYGNGLFYNVSSWTSCFQKDCKEESVKEDSSQASKMNQTLLDMASNNLFPDLGGDNNSGVLVSPPSHLLPSNLELSDIDCESNFEHIKNQIQMNKSKKGPKEKQFSCLENIDKGSKIVAKSWSEYKHKKSQNMTESSTLFDHLWKESVTPLMCPSDITSYKDVMDRLQIIQSANSETLVPDVSSLVTKPKVSFDVHLPDQRFKKTMPGAPDHRVCVTRSDGVPPGLNAIQYFSNKYKDGVPLHWAVVDSGEIAFYIFDNSKSVEVLSV